MHRIDTPTAQKDKFGAGKNGFTRGNPQTGTPATDLDDDYFDMLQEELAGVVEASGASLDKVKHNQLLTALKGLLLSRVHPFADIKADGAAAIAEALANLGLGTAAKLTAAQAVTGSPGYIMIPALIGGVEKSIIIQWMAATTSDYTSTVSVNFPIAFPNAMISAFFGDISSAAVDLSSTTPYNLAAGRGYYTSASKTQINCAGYGGFNILAIGW